MTWAIGKSTNNEYQPSAVETAARTRRLMDRRGCAWITFYKIIYELTIMANKCNYVIISIRRLDEARLRNIVCWLLNGMQKSAVRASLANNNIYNLQWWKACCTKYNRLLECELLKRIIYCFKKAVAESQTYHTRAISDWTAWFFFKFYGSSIFVTN